MGRLFHCCLFSSSTSKSRLCWLLFQVFVNFAREQHAEDERHAYDNRVDTTDELPLRPMHEEDKL